MKSTNFVYTGQETLETLVEAKKYNNYLCNIIAREADKLKVKDIKILDFGAGVGTYTDLLSEKYQYRADCVEIDRKQASILRKKGYRVYDDISEVKTKYDIIFTLNVLEHIEDDEKAIADLKNCLSSQGVLVVYVPASKLLFSNLDREVQHFRRYRIKSLVDLAVKEKLITKEIKYCDPLGFFAALAYRICNGSGTLNPRSVRFYDKYLFPVSSFIEPVSKKAFGKNVLGIFSNQ